MASISTRSSLWRAAVTRQLLRSQVLNRPNIARFAVAPIAARSFLTIVKQGHEAWRLSLGGNATKLEPGIRLCIPGYHSLEVRGQDQW